MFSKSLMLILLLPIVQSGRAQNADPFKPDATIGSKPGFDLVWHDEFNTDGSADSTNWKYETGFQRNHELQWYLPANAHCTGGLLVITGKREQVRNTEYMAGSDDWRKNREFADYTSASLRTRGLHQWRYGHFEIRARIDSSKGSWPAIWTLGASGRWPSNGEIDIMEFYRVKSVPTLLANVAWGTDKPNVAKWDDARVPLAEFTGKDPEWVKKFHIWSMDWTKDSVRLLLDGRLMNSTALNETLNQDGSNPMQQPHFLLLNLALGGNGDDPSATHFPVRYEIDYVRVYQRRLLK